MGLPLFARRSGAPRFARRALSFCAAAVTAVGLAACNSGNAFTSPANSINEIRTFSVWALTGTSSALPAAVLFTTSSLERPQVLSNGAVNFDVAFDITTDGRVAFLPVRWVVPAPPAGAPSVGLTRSTQPFESITRAPERGFTRDTAVVIAVNEVVLLELRGAGCTFGEPFYAKATVDSVITAERRIVLRTLVNRNCGYRSLTEGLPRN
jgi:hypothetical protein